MRWLSDQALDRLRTAAEAPDLTGTRYRIVERIARGGMGTVYLAEDTMLGRRVALKVLDVPDARGELAARMLREARILARLEHPGVVPIHDVGRLADGRVFYTMKFVQGSRLDQHLQHVTSLPDLLRIFQKICDAVAFAHAHGVLHRDLKPTNIMVGPFGEVLVMDWGVAKILRGLAGGADAEFGGPAQEPGTPHRAESASARQELPVGNSPAPPTAGPAETAHGVVLGTPGYMAPEQARGEISSLDERVDVFALGAILRFLLTGHSPQEATTAGAADRSASESSSERKSLFNSAVPRPLAAIRAKAMSHDPAERYATAEELAADVARYLDGLPVIAYPEGVFGKAARLISRHRTAVILVLAYLLMRTLLLIFAGR